MAATVKERATAPVKAPDVFLSYAREDTAVADSLSDGLSGAGFKVWIDRTDIPDAADWKQRAHAGVEGAKAVLCLLSKDWAASEYCRFEGELAAQLHKRIVPVTVPPEVRPESLPDAVRGLSWIPLEQGVDDAALQRIRKALETDLAWRDVHTRLLVRAGEWEAGNKDKSRLLRGGELRDAERWLEGPVPTRESVAPRHTAFILASRRAAARRQRTLFGVVAAGLLLAVALAAAAWWQRDVARKNEREADAQRKVAERNARESRSRELAAVATSELRDDPELALLLGLEAAKAASTVQAEEVLRAALPRTNRALVLQHPGITDVAADDDGTVAVTGGTDGLGRTWDLRSGKRLAVLRGHSALQQTDYTKGVTGVAMSPDGKLAAAAGAEGDVRVWEPRTGRLLQRLKRPTGGPSDFGIALAFAGPGLVTAGNNGVVRSWDPSSGDEVAAHAMRGFQVTGLSVTADGSRVAAVASAELGGPGRVEVLDAAALRPVAGISGDAFDATFSPDGRRLATSWVGTIEVWNVESGAPVRSFEGRAMAFSPDSRTLAVASGTGVIRLMDVASGAERRGMRQAGAVSAVGFNADGTQLVTAGADKTARLWDVRSGRALQTFSGHRSVLGTAAFLGDRILTRGGDGTARVWSPSVDAPLELRGHGAVIDDVALAGDGTRLVTASEDGTARLWDLPSGRRIARLAHGSGDAHPSVAVSPDGKTIATAGVAPAKLWRAQDGGAVATVPGDSGGGAVFSGDGRYVVTLSGIVWDMRRKRAVKRLGEFLGVPVAVGRDAVFRATFNGDAEILALPSGRRLARLGRRTPGRFMDAAVAPDAKVLALGSDGQVALWTTASGKEIGALSGEADIVSGHAFSPDGSRLLTTSGRGVRIWDVARRQPIADLAHPGHVSSVGFSRDGRFVVTAGDDGRVRVWEARTGQPILRLPGRSKWIGDEGFVPHAMFTADGRSVVAATGGATAFVDPCSVCVPLPELVAKARRATARSLSEDERLTYLGG